MHIPSSCRTIGSLIALRARSHVRHMSWGERLFWMFGALVLSSIMFLIILMSSQDGVSTLFSLAKKKDLAVHSLENVFVVEDAPVSGSGASSSFPETSSSQSIVQQADNLMKVVAPSEQPLSSWLFTLQNTKITSLPIVVHVRPANVFTPRQEAILKTQKIQVLPWSDRQSLPKSMDQLTNEIHFWVGKRGDKDWVIHGSVQDMLTTHAYQSGSLNSLDLMRVILWSDELPLQEKWFAENPAPSPPDHLKPSNVSLGLIPSTIALQQTFWLLVGFMGLMVASCGSLAGLVFWQTLHKEGAFEALSSLPFKTWILPASYILQWTLGVFAVVLLSVVLAVVPAVLLSVPLPWFSLLKAVFLAVVFSCFMISFSVMVSSWFSKAWWRLWFFPVFAFFVLGLEFFYMVFFFESRLITSFLHGWGMMAMMVALMGLSLGMWHQTARRLDRHGRLGLRKF